MRYGYIKKKPDEDIVIKAVEKQVISRKYLTTIWYWLYINSWNPGYCMLYIYPIHFI